MSLKTNKIKKLQFNTLAAKTYLDGKKERRPLSNSIQPATTFQVESSEAHGHLFKEGADSVYQRFGHPTLSLAAEKIARLEGAETAEVFPSGMAAITTSLITLLKPGDHVVAQREIFAQTFTFLDKWARSFGIQTDFIEGAQCNDIESAIKPNTKLIYIETPSNPLLRIVNISQIAELAKQRNLDLFVDSTFASPYLQNPLNLGASLVLHSGTKFLGGHSDVMCGVAAGNHKFLKKVREKQILLGTILDPRAAWLLIRGLKTLSVRVERQSDNALALAKFLSIQNEISVVNYPWLESSPDCDLARRQMRGGGGVLSFDIKGGLNAARAFVNALEVIPIATSLGGIETVIEIPYELDFSEEELGDAALSTGISPSLVRLSVGIENIEDLIDDLKNGLLAI